MTKQSINAQRPPIVSALVAAVTAISLLLHLGQAVADIYHDSSSARALGRVALGILPVCAAMLTYRLQRDGANARNRSLWVAGSLSAVALVLFFTIGI